MLHHFQRVPAPHSFRVPAHASPRTGLTALRGLGALTVRPVPVDHSRASSLPMFARPTLAPRGAVPLWARTFSTPVRAGETAARFFEAQAFTSQQQADVRRCLDGVHLKTLIPPGLANQDGRALAKGFVRMFFKDLVERHPDRSEFAGETVVAASPAIAHQKKGSDYVMWFGKGARQHPHFHPGDRYLVIFAPAGLKVLLGGSDPRVLAQERVSFARVSIPPGVAVLSFAKRDVLHGFMGEDEEGFGALSHHSDDLGEVMDKLRAQGADADGALRDKDLMGSLTDYVPPHKVSVIGDTDIPAHVVQDLVRQRNESQPGASS